jgi:hypothetical protein
VEGAPTEEPRPDATTYAVVVRFYTSAGSVVMRLAGLSSHGACSRGVPPVVGHGSGWGLLACVVLPLSPLGPGTNVFLVGLIPK